MPRMSLKWRLLSPQCRPGAALAASAQRHFSSPRIRQNSRLCIRPGTRRHPREPNDCGSVYSRWCATSCRKVSNSSSSGRRPSLAIVGVDPHQPPRPVIAPQHARGGPGVDVDDEGRRGRRGSAPADSGTAGRGPRSAARTAGRRPASRAAPVRRGLGLACEPGPRRRGPTCDAGHRLDASSMGPSGDRHAAAIGSAPGMSIASLPIVGSDQ